MSRRRGAARGAAAGAALAAALTLLCGAAAAQTAGPRDVPLGGRPAGLGHAYTALADDAYAPAWNPAGLGFSAVPQAALMQAAAAGGSASERALLAVPLAGAFGLGASLDFSRGAAAYGAALGRRVSEHAALGASTRYLEGSAADGRPHGMASDLAGLYRFDDRLSVGAVAANLGGRPQSLRTAGSQAPQARLGAGYSPARWLTWALEGVFESQGRAGVRSGVELLAWHALAARVGIDSTVEGSPALGLTAGLGLTWGAQSFDVAYVPDGRSSWEQASVVVRFGSLPDGTFAKHVEAAPVAAAPPAPVVAPAPGRSSREEPRTFHFDAGSSTATLTSAPAVPAGPTPGASGFVQPAPQGDWRAPKQPQIPEKPDVKDPPQPGMIWLQQ